MVKVTKPDFLNACSHVEWRTTLEIKGKIEKALNLKRHSVSIAQVFTLAAQLEDEGFIETRQTPDIDGKRGGQPKLEVRITQSGIRARHETVQESTDGSFRARLKPA